MGTKARRIMLPSDAAALLRWYRTNGRKLPWRDHPTPYRVWVSEIMLQQTQVRTVLPFFERFMGRFPDIQSLAAAPEPDVLQLWAGLGYYRRARNLHRAARIIVAGFGGRFPDTHEAIIALPGIGRYTAGAILSIAFNQAHPAVDGNVVRVISRLQAIESQRPDRFFREEAAASIPPNEASNFNQALMELGALVCVPAAPKCNVCPLRAQCKARERGIQNRIPRPQTKSRGERVELVVLVAVRGNEVMVCRPARGSFIPGDLGLPTRILRPGETAGDSAPQFAREVHGAAVTVAMKGRVSHAIGQRRIVAHVYRVDCDGGAGACAPNWIPLRDAAPQFTSSLFRKALQAATDSLAAHKEKGRPKTRGRPG